MKKCLMLFLALALFLVGCSPTTTGSSKEAKRETAIYEYSRDVGGLTQVVRETIIYKGDEFLSLGLHITQPSDEDFKNSLAGQDFEAVKAEVLPIMEEQSFIKDLRTIEGVTASVDVTQDYVFLFDVTIDMQKVDLEALSAVTDFDVDFTSFQDTTPKDHIASLKDKGAKLVTE